MTKKEILEKLKDAYQGSAKLRKSEEEKGNQFADSQAFGYLKQAVKSLLILEGIEIQA